MRGLGQGLALLFMISMIVKFIWWILAVIVLVMLVRLAYRGFTEARTELAAEAMAVEAHHRRLIAQADRQHQWAMAGDPRGTYGDGASAVGSSPPAGA